MKSVRSVFPVLYAVVILLASCSTRGAPALNDTDTYLSEYNIELAYETIEDAYERNPEDLEIERTFWRVRKIYLLKKGQMEVFGDRDLDGLVTFQKVLALDPGNLLALEWVEKAKGKLAHKAVAEGDRLRASGKLKAALPFYQKALEYIPGYPSALSGKIDLADEWKKLQEKALEHFKEGNRALSELQYRQTSYNMEIALAKDPGLSEAEPPRDLAHRRHAERRYEQAKEWVDEGHFAAALKEFGSLLGKLPGRDEELHELIAHMKKECESRELKEKGEMAIFRGEFKVARELLLKAFDLSEGNRVEISDSLLFVTERELEHRYLLAKDIEFEGDLVSALALYIQIDKDLIPGLDTAALGDLKARIGDLQSTVDEVRKSVAAGDAAEAKGELDVAIDHFEEAIELYPKFQDLSARIAKLKAARSASK